MNRHSLKRLLLLCSVLLLTSIHTSQAASYTLQTKIYSHALASNQAPRATQRPSQTHWSAEAQTALQFVAAQHKIDIHNLRIINEFNRPAPLLRHAFQAVTIADLKTSQLFKLLVDKATKQIQEKQAVESAEATAQNNKYGKLQPALYERLQQLSDSDTLTVTIVLTAPANQGLSASKARAQAVLGAKYPEVQQAIARGASPLAVKNRTLAKKVYSEYIDLLRKDISQRLRPLLVELKSQKLMPLVVDGLPALTLRTSAPIVRQLAVRSDVGTIFLSEPVIVRGAMHTAIESSQAVQELPADANKAPYVWQQGHTGTNVSIAIVEPGKVDFTSIFTDCPSGTNNCFAHPGATRLDYAATEDHATGVASMAASTHPLYKGMAPNATIVSANYQTNPLTGATFETEIASAVGWALNHGAADIVSTSQAACSTSTAMTSLDWSYDYQARFFSRLLVVAAGNGASPQHPDCGGATVVSPGKAWNVLTVGAYDTATDQMARLVVNGIADIESFSGWQNPSSSSGDHEKPEVVAPGYNLSFVANNGQVYHGYLGTSLATPQVAGLGALLIDTNHDLYFDPNATRAIIMSSATKNIEGPTGIDSSFDLHDGAGAIDAQLAYETALTHVDQTTTCATSCWWSEDITASSFPYGTRQYTFTANAGDRIRVAANWWAQSDCADMTFSCSSDSLQTDLDLSISDDQGRTLPTSYSSSWGNNYELTPSHGEIIIPHTGTYHIWVSAYAGFTEASNTLGLALTKWSPPSNGGAVQGAVYFDADWDGTRGDPADEVAVDGFPVILRTDNGDGVFDAATDSIATGSLSDANGQYIFTGLAPGSYWVTADEWNVTVPVPLGLITIQAGQTVQGIDIPSSTSCVGCT